MSAELTAPEAPEGVVMLLPARAEELLATAAERIERELSDARAGIDPDDIAEIRARLAEPATLQLLAETSPLIERLLAEEVAPGAEGHAALDRARPDPSRITAVLDGSLEDTAEGLEIVWHALERLEVAGFAAGVVRDHFRPGNPSRPAPRDPAVLEAMWLERISIQHEPVLIGAFELAQIATGNVAWRMIQDIEDLGLMSGWGKEAKREALLSISRFHVRAGAELLDCGTTATDDAYAARERAAGSS